MDDALLVRGLERIGHLTRDRESLVDRDCAASKALRQVLALDEFHDQRLRRAGLIPRVLHAIQVGDVWMVEGREYFGFTLEARQSIRIGGV